MGNRGSSQTQGPQIIVRPAAPGDRAAWREMWSAYCAFYEADIPERVTEKTWSRILAGDGSIHALIAQATLTGPPLGFANYIIHPFTWSEAPACYLEDLFVRPEARGKRVGRALIERLITLGEQERWARLYWMTRESNAPARMLYDRFAPCDDFVRYVKTFEDAITTGEISRT